MIDEAGFRSNVGIVLCNARGEVFWGRRIGMDAWQFPQGGIKRDETPEQAMFRELHEEVGLRPGHVEIIASTQNWLRYRLPKRFIKVRRKPLCIGQKQRWFAVRLLADEESVDLNCADKPEFEAWRWVNFWHPVEQVVEFKRAVYRRALTELAPQIDSELGSELSAQIQ